MGRFVIFDKDVDSHTGMYAIDLAVSRSNNPTTLSAGDWAFYKIDVTESGFGGIGLGNIGYNADAVVFTLNMFGTTS